MQKGNQYCFFLSLSDFSKGFGGKYGTDPNAQDKSAVGFSHRETVPKHPSQQGYFQFKILFSLFDVSHN
jgi:hypothetical protein